ncbi:MAG TPA: pyridoxamine 5'-phosphate oxidase family protein, partial [Acidimicrobiales bacterium]|nr:pyridoxamine 5'-phosphate oxidase family protein [Acidimicrobiales bacterium]
TRAAAAGPRTVPPNRRRPHMPGYGVPEGPDGMLPWSFAEERLTASHDYWLATARPNGPPHVMPVWGAWTGGRFWFSTDQGSRKARNLRADPRCTVTTDNARQPVVLDGVAEAVVRRDEISAFADELSRKYAEDWAPEVYTVDFFDGSLGGGATYRVVPTSVFALDADRFATSPTCWEF